MLTATLIVTKMAAKLSRWLGRGGGQALPGLVAERLDPNLASKLAARLPHGVVLVTGTNGKTTTTKLIAAALEAAGERVLTNSTGSNLKRGVTSALIAEADLNGRLDATVGLFEVDEASLRQVAPAVQPKAIVVLNLFRDQLDRYGELDTLASVIGQGIAATKAELFLNADDPLVASLAKYAADANQVTYFGVEQLAEGAGVAQTAMDSDRCPVCRERLMFSRVFYGHIGHYRCPKGHFERPKPAVTISKVISTDLDGSQFEVTAGGKHMQLHFPLAGTYNLYNALAAMVVAQGLGVGDEQIVEVLGRAEAAFGRVERVSLEGRTVYLLLIKNPAGFTQVLETFLMRRGLKVMLAINDLDADGRDVSWLWDVPLEVLAEFGPKIVTAGIRGADMALRLHYAGIESEPSGDFEGAINKLLGMTAKGETVYILPTYTAMLQIRKLLEKRTQMVEVWK
ncbi:MAG TPA: MurT ligase domain-containing protein [Candidatus Saccharimonadia bacterium]|jgi:UDP-N-acetylmuramyl tripeptide synthase